MDTNVAPINKLQEAQGNFEAAVKQRDKLIVDANESKNKLAKRNDDLQAALLSGRDTQQMENDIVALQVKNAGFQKAIESQTETVNNLQTKLAYEKRMHFLRVAEEIKDQYVAQRDIAYELLFQFSSEIAKLKTIGIQYWQAVREAGAMENGPYNSRIKSITDGVTWMEREIKKILSGRVK